VWTSAAWFCLFWPSLIIAAKPLVGAPLAPLARSARSFCSLAY
jgi:hypothetical protein